MRIVCGLTNIVLLMAVFASAVVTAQETRDQVIAADPGSRVFFTPVARAAPEYPANYSRHNSVGYLVVEYSPQGQQRAAFTRMPVTSGGSGDEAAAAVLHRWKY